MKWIDFFKLPKEKQNRNLIIAAVGDDSLHSSWIDNPSIKNFDLMLIYYGKTSGKFKDDALYYAENPGFKYHLIHDVATSLFKKEIERYDSIWCPDDDLLSNTDELNKMFDTFEEYELNVAQPSLTKDSFYSLPITLHRPANIIRYTNVVEAMCPIFNQDVFQSVLHTFKETNSGWGLDWVWPKIMGYEKCGIIDTVQVKHTRPPRTGELYKKFRGAGIVPPREKKAILTQYGIYVCVCTELDQVEILSDENDVDGPMYRVCHIGALPIKVRPLSRPRRRDNNCSGACRIVGNRLLDFKKLYN